MSSTFATLQTEAAILTRLMGGPQDELSPAAAEYFSTIRSDDRDINRMNELSELARQGTLSNEQQAELGHIHPCRQSSGLDPIKSARKPCIQCNRYKRPDIAAIDSATGEVWRPPYE